MTIRHTPGPWHRNIKPARRYGVIFAGRNTHICTLSVHGLTDEEIEANCNLITAAPDMLAMLERVEAWVLESLDNRLITSYRELIKQAKEGR